MQPRPPRSTSPTVRSGLWQRRARLLIPLCLAGLMTPFFRGMMTGDAGRAVWVLDLMTHWQWLFAAGLLTAIITAASADRRWSLLLPAAALPLVSATPELPTAAAAPSLTVASANIHVDTRDPAELLRWLTTEDPDVVVVLEVSPPAAAALDTLRGYPFRVLQPDDSPFGIALLSKLPIASSAVVRDADGIPHIRADLAFGERTIGVTALHPMPPVSPRLHNLRNALLRAQTAAIDRPAILAGDLNATPWSSAFTGMEELGWRRATSLLPTWPAWGQGVFGIPIDHVLASSEWRIVDRKVGPSLGSDHLPVLVKLALTNTVPLAPATAQWKPIAKAYAKDQTTPEPAQGEPPREIK